MHFRHSVIVRMPRQVNVLNETKRVCACVYVSARACFLYVCVCETNIFCENAN